MELHAPWTHPSCGAPRSLDASSPHCRAKHRSTTAVRGLRVIAARSRSACRGCTCTHRRRGTPAADAARRQCTLTRGGDASYIAGMVARLPGWPSVAVKGGTGAGSARKVSATTGLPCAACERPMDRGPPNTLPFLASSLSSLLFTHDSLNDLLRNICGPSAAGSFLRGKPHPNLAGFTMNFNSF